jgi:hypothetical protein
MMQNCVLTHTLGFYALNYTIHGEYIKWSSGPDFKKTLLYYELMIYDKYRGKNTGPKCVKILKKITNTVHYLGLTYGKFHSGI